MKYLEKEYNSHQLKNTLPLAIWMERRLKRTMPRQQSRSSYLSEANMYWHLWRHSWTSFSWPAMPWKHRIHSHQQRWTSFTPPKSTEHTTDPPDQQPNIWQWDSGYSHKSSTEKAKLRSEILSGHCRNAAEKVKFPSFSTETQRQRIKKH